MNLFVEPDSGNLGSQSILDSGSALLIIQCLKLFHDLHAFACSA